MDYIPLMTTATSSSEPYRVCAICFHEHESTATMVDGYGGELICADEDACEQREEANEKWPQSDHDIDWSDPPEDAAPAHLDGEPDCEEVDGGRGWYDYDDGSCEKWYD